MVKFAALLFVVVCAGVSGFQLALALGAPWGELTLGGRWSGRLPPAVRLIPLISVATLGVFSAVILARAGYDVPLIQGSSRALAWVVVGYCALGCIANAITPSARERRLWLPVGLGMLLLSVAVAVS
jgi:hypothetical protein